MKSTIVIDLGWCKIIDDDVQRTAIIHFRNVGTMPVTHIGAHTHWEVRRCFQFICCFFTLHISVPNGIEDDLLINGLLLLFKIKIITASLDAKVKLA